MLASLCFISEKVGDNFKRGNSEDQGRFVEGSSRKSSKSAIKKFHNSLKCIFSPGHVRGLVQRQAKHGKGGER